MSDLIDRQAAIEWVNSLMDVQKYYHPHSKSTRFPLEEVIDVLQQVPSAQPNLQQTCNQLATDCISRQAAIDALNEVSEHYTDKGREWHPHVNFMVEAIEALPSAQPEYRTDEWCTDCKEYDQEKHCCPRFNHVIRTTLQDAQRTGRKKGKFIGTEYDGYADGNPVYYEWKCSECGCIFEDEEPTYNFCPNCGARMEVEEDA